MGDGPNRQAGISFDYPLLGGLALMPSFQDNPPRHIRAMFLSLVDIVDLAGRLKGGEVELICIYFTVCRAVA